MTELDLHDRVEFLRMLPERDLPAFLHSLDIYAQSSHGESMSAVMQAMAAGLPVVGTDVPGLGDMVRADGTRLLFPCDNETKLVQALESLVHSPNDRRRMGANARRHAVANSVAGEDVSRLRGTLDEDAGGGGARDQLVHP